MQSTDYFRMLLTLPAPFDPQGGCMAIEDAYQLSLTLDEHVRGASSGQPVDIESALKNYQAVSIYL